MLVVVLIEFASLQLHSKAYRQTYCVQLKAIAQFEAHDVIASFSSLWYLQSDFYHSLLLGFEHAHIYLLFNVKVVSITSEH